jgi:hypothetical protein
MKPHISLMARPTAEPRMERWTSLSPRLGTDSEFKFMDDFFALWRRRLIVIEDFPYAEVDFLGSVDLVIPEGIDWDESSTKPNLVMCFFILKFILFLCVQRGVLIDVVFHHADRGASSPAEMSALGHHRDVQIVVEHEVPVEGLQEVERKL